MGVNNFPNAVDAPKQESFITAIVDFAVVLANSRLDFRSGDCPGKVTLDVGLIIATLSNSAAGNTKISFIVDPPVNNSGKCH